MIICDIISAFRLCTIAVALLNYQLVFYWKLLIKPIKDESNLTRLLLKVIFTFIQNFFLLQSSKIAPAVIFGGSKIGFQAKAKKKKIKKKGKKVKMLEGK